MILINRPHHKLALIAWGLLCIAVGSSSYATAGVRSLQDLSSEVVGKRLAAEIKADLSLLEVQRPLPAIEAAVRYLDLAILKKCQDLNMKLIWLTSYIRTRGIPAVPATLPERVVYMDSFRELQPLSNGLEQNVQAILYEGLNENEPQVAAAAAVSLAGRPLLLDEISFRFIERQVGWLQSPNYTLRRVAVANLVTLASDSLEIQSRLASAVLSESSHLGPLICSILEGIQNPSEELRLALGKKLKLVLDDPSPFLTLHPVHRTPLKMPATFMKEQLIEQIQKIPDVDSKIKEIVREYMERVPRSTPTRKDQNLYPVFFLYLKLNGSLASILGDRFN